MSDLEKTNCEKLYDYLKKQYGDTFSLDISSGGEKIVANFGYDDVTFEVGKDGGIFLYTQNGDLDF